jgi:hypothetical protein
MGRLLIILFLILPELCFALGPQYQGDVMRWRRYLVEKHPRYTMDEKITPATAMALGVDCSMSELLVHMWGGVPGVQRTTAYRMSLGFGGWEGYDIENFDDLEAHDHAYFTFASALTRIRGHIGAKISDTEFMHSGVSTKGPAMVPLNSQWIRKSFVVGRHLTIGE